MLLRTRMAQRAGGSSERAAPTLVSAKLASASLIDPLQQGDALIGLSGIYAITNGIRLAVAHKRHLTAGEVHTLMAVGFDYLSGRLTPKQAFQSGCRVSVWRGMAAAMIDVARHRLDLRLRVDRLIVESSGRHHAFLAIEAAIERWRPVLMLCRGGCYTVVSGFTPSSLLLFDSRAGWLSKRACGVPGDSDNARHLLIPSSLTALRA